ncbi:MAG: hypothetical protein ACI8UP_003353 [Porticoccaceae bacterium]|jgi:hypothetical protein
MKMTAKLENEYQEMRTDSALVTAADAKYAPFLFNALSSIHSNFPTHPLVYVFDLGLSRAQRCELKSVPWVRLRKIEKFAPHWKTGWSWKPYILTRVRERYVLYFDAANIVLYRSIALWFLAIKRHGFFGIANGQRMQDVTPSDYWSMFGLDPDACAGRPTFGAGLFGFDQIGPAGAAISKCLALTIAGWNLGRSASEQNPLYGNVALRDCVCFRSDQTLINLAIIEHMGSNILIRDELRYCGLGGQRDHVNQYLWYARRNKNSMIYFFKPMNAYSAVFMYNRATSWMRLVFRWRASEILKWFESIFINSKCT